MSGLHAPLAPSSAYQWVTCSGSVAANFQAPARTEQRTREGEASHWVGEQCLSSKQVVLPSEFIGKTAPNGVVIDDEMVEGADIYRRAVLDVCGNGHLDRMFIEHKVFTGNRIHEHCWGTPDTFAFFPAENVLHIWDYKYGHREVKAVENWQMICYAAGIANEFMLNDNTVVNLHVVQPFCYYAESDATEWSRTWGGLQPYVERLREAANIAMNTTPTMTTGLHCRDCPAVGRCSAARKYCYSVATYVKEPYAIETMKGPDLAAERSLLDDALRVGKARLEAIEDQLKDSVARGDRSSGLTLQVKTGRTTWSAPPETVIQFAKQFGVDVSVPGVLTPAQATKKIPSGIRPVFEQGVKRLTKTGTTGMALVPIEGSATSRAFSQ